MKLVVAPVRLMVCLWRLLVRNYLAQEIQAFTLFATHYFELTALADEIAYGARMCILMRLNMAIKLFFCIRCNAGPANQSYGIQVAQLAGVPRPVIHVAKQKLQELENQTHVQPVQQMQLALEPEVHPVVARLQEIDPDALSPRDALQVLFELKSYAKLG